MCGFFGQINFDGLPVISEEIKQLGKLSQKRGPDNTGYYDGGFYGLLFNRLSILDLSETGHQPKVSPSGRYKMLFNGEIYNHLELRNHLENNIVYRSTGDAETLIQLFQHWGIEKTIKSLDGMFAIVLVDELEKKCHLIRDFAGIKPLYYGYKNNQLVFASQYDQVAKHSCFKNEEVNKDVLRLYMEQHFVPSPFGLLKNTAQVAAGQWLTFAINGLNRQALYWTFPEYIEPKIHDKKNALEYLDDILSKSVNAEMLSDVPLGSFLSGGVDSPLVTYYAKKYTTQKLKAFSIGSDSSIHDESENAKTYADLLGVEHHLHKMTAREANELWEEAIKAIHEPFADFSILPTYAVSKLARKDVKVALSGDGGDELFFGYERFASVVKNYGYQHLPSRLKYMLYGADKVIFKNRHINSAVLFDDFGKAHRGLHSRTSSQWLTRLFPHLQGVSVPDSYDVYEYEPADKDALLQSMRKAEFYGMMQKTLRKVDMASMEVSLEVRVPFLKKSMIESSLLIDHKLSYGLHKKKQLLKDLLSHNVPGSPIDNIKKGFSVPLSKWIREDLQERFRTLNENEFLKEIGMSGKSYNVMLEEHIAGRADHKWPLFTIFGLQAWI